MLTLTHQELINLTDKKYAPAQRKVQQYLQQATLSVDSKRESSFASKTDYAALANMTLERIRSL